MGQEFVVKFNAKSRRSYTIIISLGIALFCSLPLISSLEDPSGQNSLILITIIAAFFVLISIMGLLSLYKCSLVFREKTITTKGLFRNKTYQVADLTGYIIVAQELQIRVKSKLMPLQIKRSLENASLAKKWCEKYLKPINPQKTKFSQFRTLLSNPQFGATISERKDKFKKAKKTYKVLLWLSIFLGLWGIINIPYKVPIYLCLAFPFLALAITAPYKGIILFDGKQENNIYPVFLPIYIVPTFLLSLKVLRMNFCDLSQLFSFIAIALLVCFLIFCLRFKKELKNKLSISLALFFLVPHASLLVIYINNAHNPTPPVTLSSTISDKKEVHGKHQSFHLTLEHQSKLFESPYELEVHKDTYRRKQKNDTLNIHFHKGLLGIDYLHSLE